jgi:hypothetical protein
MGYHLKHPKIFMHCHKEPEFHITAFGGTKLAVRKSKDHRKNVR